MSHYRAFGFATSLAMLGTGCVGSAHNTHVTNAEIAARSRCSVFNPLMDAYVALQSPASYGASSELYYLVDLDEDIGYVRIARKKIEDLPGPEAATLREQFDRLLTAFEARRSKLQEAAHQIAKAYERSEIAIDQAAICNHVNMRDGATANSKKALSTKTCEPAVRLWSAVRDVDLTSDVSTAQVAAHSKELALDGPLGERSQIRDRLAAALDEQAKSLRAYHAIGAPKRSGDNSDVERIVALKLEVTNAIDALNHQCIDGMTVSDRVVGGDAVPRIVTVTVRPKWTGSLASLSGAEQVEFGSGFVVRWRNAKGEIETRVVTNNHVMGGAFEAEIVSGDPKHPVNAAAEGDDEKSKRTNAVLVSSDPHEDVAILKLVSTTSKEFDQGLRFRLEPAREQEQVVAAGFPGVGMRPSFQVSRGIVSNAKFGAESDEASATAAYVQHTAPIDPGNSGGPLLDAHGFLLGMNTFKISGRENVGLAIPTSRIQEALVRSEETTTFDMKQAESSCNAALAALASENPVRESMSRFGLALFDKIETEKTRDDEVTYRDRVSGNAGNPVEVARAQAYAHLRAAVEVEEGVRPFEMCSDMKRDRATHTYSATMHTRKHEHEIILAEEHGVIRVIEFRSL